MYVIQNKRPQKLSPVTVSKCLSYRNVMFGWFPTQPAQECLGKLSYKSQLAGACVVLNWGHFAIFFKMSSWSTVLISHFSLGINQLHFISCSAVFYRFYHSFSYCNESLLAHLVARFIVQCHFVAIYACSELRAPRPWPYCKLARTRSCRSMIALALAFLSIQVIFRYSAMVLQFYFA